jgi:hypothetical protein
MRRFFEVWLDLGFCWLLLAAFFLLLIRIGLDMSIYDLGLHDLLALFIAPVGGGFVSAIIVTKHEAKINRLQR